MPDVPGVSGLPGVLGVPISNGRVMPVTIILVTRTFRHSYGSCKTDCAFFILHLYFELKLLIFWICVFEDF